jgi:hypothetical protein
MCFGEKLSWFEAETGRKSGNCPEHSLRLGLASVAGEQDRRNVSRSMSYSN